MKSNEINKPTKLNIFFGLCISILQEILPKKAKILPKKIKKYTLLQKVNKATRIIKYAIGIYKGGQKKVFIKTWIGRYKNFEYYDLINEAFATRILSQVLTLQNNKSKLKINVPKVIEIIRDKESTSIVFEFLEGNTLGQYPKNMRVEIISHILNTFSEISHSLTNELKNELNKQDIVYFIISFPLFLIMDIVSDFKNSKVIFKACVDFIKSIKTVNNQNYTLAFRDINKDNILINGKSIYLVDCGRLSLTIYGYDFESIAVCKYFKDIYREVYKKSNYSTNRFLLTHNLIHHAYTFDRRMLNKNESVQKLHEIYGG